MSVTNYFYQQELEELATTEVAQKFAQLRKSGNIIPKLDAKFKF